MEPETSKARDGRYEETLSTSQSLPAWKEEINAKLHEHRSRRKVPADQQSRLAELEPSFASGSRQPAASRIAARVAERYAKAPSYREMIEQEAANTPARLVTRAPEQASAAQPDPEPNLFEPAPVDATPTPEAAAPHASQSQPSVEPRARHNRWAEFEPSPVPEFFSGPAAPAAEPEIAAHTLAEESAPAQTRATEPVESLFFEPEAAPANESPSEPPALPNFTPEPEEAHQTLSLLDELATQPIEPAQPLPARIIEFPRELVAPRKARPRRERTSAHDHQSQLRIFEAEPEAAAVAEPETEIAPPAKSEPSPAPAEWNAIRLDEEPSVQASAFFKEVGLAEPSSSLLLDPPIYTANLEDRLMAGIVDICLVGAGFLTFVAVFAACTPHMPTGKLALVAAGAALLAFFVVYQYLFLTYSSGTPGMRYAQIALCTFDDENPTPQSLRARIGYILLSALPLGLGFLWSLFDEDRLGWHDRITRTYQRSYREN